MSLLQFSIHTRHRAAQPFVSRVVGIAFMPVLPDQVRRSLERQIEQFDSSGLGENEPKLLGHDYEEIRILEDWPYA
jgi:hypothetical protein